jgi:hypothetical protein
MAASRSHIATMPAIVKLENILRQRFFPCRFPAALWIIDERRSQANDFQ